MGKIKVINKKLDKNLNGASFTNTASQTIFQFGLFNITSNFDSQQHIDYTNHISSFVKPITLETLNFTEIESDLAYNFNTNVTLNLDKTDLNRFVKFGSAFELIRKSLENIIIKYPGSLYISSENNNNIIDFKYDPIKNISSFKVPTRLISNKFDLIYNKTNLTISEHNKINNLNLSYDKYIIWTEEFFDNYSHSIVGFTGSTNITNSYISLECIGNPFPFITGSTIPHFSYHIRPSIREYDNFRYSLSNFEKFLISNREGDKGFIFNIKEPILLDNGDIQYNDVDLLWNTFDGYNIDYNTPTYRTFLESILSIGKKYDTVKTDLIARFLTPASLKVYDYTEEGKMTKLLQTYGWEFDRLKEFIDSLVYINKITYDKKDNLPNQIVQNLARTFGWDVFQLVNEGELVDNLFTVNDEERNLETELTPAEIDIELWRRILINTNYFWKSKGTRDAIKAVFTLIGIPEPFINITEYVYTVDGKINPNTVPIDLVDLPSISLPYDDDGYPIAPIETNDFFFQISGDTDSGQAYMNNFRMVGFDLHPQIDNKKSWVQTGGVYRRDDSTPTYYQEDSKLVLNTKEIDISLDTAQAIEYDIYRYIHDIDFPANSTGYTVPFTYINLSLNVPVGGTQEFELPFDLGDPQGDVEVRYNGIVLNAPKYYDWSGDTLTEHNSQPLPPYPYDERNEYWFDPNNPRKFYILQPANNQPGVGRDVIEATYIYKKNGSLSQITVKYMVVRINPNLNGTIIDLPDIPNGDVQLTINGIAATQGSNIVQADYIKNPSNPQQLIIQNQDLIAYLATHDITNNPIYAQVAYISVSGSSNINARQDVSRVDTLCGGKVYYSNTMNKVIYKLNYKVFEAKNVKILVDGIALEPETDYTVNPNNPYEILLPPTVNLGSVVTAFYMVANGNLFNPIIDDNFGLGDISKLSFLQFIELVQRRLINASNRKVISDFKGGWYPTLLRVYNEYIRRSCLDDNDPLKSNGYTFNNLYTFLTKYNSFFQRFVNQLLSATIIQKKGGLLIRNTVFTKQKFTYKRGVVLNDSELNYFGNDGSVFIKRLPTNTFSWTDDYVCVN